LEEAEGKSRDRLAPRAGLTIGQVSELTSAIAAAIERQGAATQEIARNVLTAEVAKFLATMRAA
jgi:hypothetical protein